MERELWCILAAHLTLMSTHVRRGRFVHPTARILRVYLWAVLHDRPVYWACDRRHWVGVKPPATLPDQSTMSRRLARPQTRRALDDLLDRLEPVTRDALVLRIDGKPLPVAKHSVDRRATIGCGAGGFQKGYKLHAIYAGNNRPVAYRVTPMKVWPPGRCSNKRSWARVTCWPTPTTRPTRCTTRPPGPGGCW